MKLSPHFMAQTVLLSTVLSLCPAQFIRAAVSNWSGAAGTPFNWNDAGNWDTPPVAGNQLIFPSSSGSSSVNNITGNPTYESLYFDVGSTFDITNGTSASANAFSLSGGLNLAGIASVKLASNLTLTASQTLAVSSTNARTFTLAGSLAIGGNVITIDTTPSSGTKFNNVTLNGPISGTGGSFIKNGGGTLTFGSNSNSFTGNIQINGGTLAAGVTGTSLGAGSGAITVQNGATLRVTGGFGTTSKNITLSGNGETTGEGNLQRGALASFSNFGAHTLSGTLTLAGDTAVGMRGGGAVGDFNFLTLSGNMQESIAGAGLNKVGSWGDPSSGFLKVTGTRTYTGTTTVTGGGLVVSGNHGSAISEATRVGDYVVTSETLTPLQTGGTAKTSESLLAGTGTVFLKETAEVSLNGASASLLARLAPGDVTRYTGVTDYTSTIGTLIIDATTHSSGSAVVSFGANSLFDVQIDSTQVGGTAGANDLLSINGGHLDLTGSSDYLQLNLLGLGTLSGEYVIATFDSVSPGSYGVFDNVIGMPSGYHLAYNATNITLSAVPEPRLGALICFALGIGIAFRNRPRKAMRV